MGEFSTDWLALREPADHRSRSVVVTERAVAMACVRGAGDDVHVLDLGTGSGSNVRFLSPRLPAHQDWCVVDRDLELLAELTKQMAARGLDRGGTISGHARDFTVQGAGFSWRFALCTADLARLGEASEPASLRTVFAGRTLVTASALLDLVSERWLQVLVSRCVEARSTALFALTYDGRIVLEPGDADDGWLVSLVNRHQRTAKSFGKALGPDATACAGRLFEAAGYHVACERSDWILERLDAALQRPLLDGWADAAVEVAKREAARVRAWQERRHAQLDAGTLRITVGHQDLAAWPPADEASEGTTDDELRADE